MKNIMTSALLLLSFNSFAGDVEIALGQSTSKYNEAMELAVQKCLAKGGKPYRMQNEDYEFNKETVYSNACIRPDTAMYNVVILCELSK